MGLPHLFLGAKADSDAADLRFVPQIRRSDLQHHRKADVARGKHGSISVRHQPLGKHGKAGLSQRALGTEFMAECTGWKRRGLGNGWLP